MLLTKQTYLLLCHLSTQSAPSHHRRCRLWVVSGPRWRRTNAMEVSSLLRWSHWEVVRGGPISSSSTSAGSIKTGPIRPARRPARQQHTGTDQLRHYCRRPLLLRPLAAPPPKVVGGVKVQTSEGLYSNITTWRFYMEDGLS
jgi:hypothetical protein